MKLGHQMIGRVRMSAATRSANIIAAAYPYQEMLEVAPVHLSSLHKYLHILEPL